jgi:hypothetical protein
MTMPVPEDDLPTTIPPGAAGALAKDQLDKLADIVGSIAIMAKNKRVPRDGRRAYGNVVSILSAFLLECQSPPSADELRKDLETT